MTIPRLADNEKCTGCGLCAGICPQHALSMALDKDGFFYPVMDEKKCINCELCEKKCPAMKVILFAKHGSEAYAAWIKDTKARKKSTSGGVFTALYETIISQNGCVFGAAFDEHLYLTHVCAEYVDGCERMRGSKYIQSDASLSYRRVKEELLKARKVLFSGTPCQIGALNAYVGKNDNLITCEILCHGVGSNKYFHDIVKNAAKKHGEKVIGVQFREKSKGWDASDFVITYADGRKERSPSYYNSFGYPFSRQIITRLSCLNCPYSDIHRVADISLGDYAGRDKKHYSCTERKNGISLLLINSEKGKAFIGSISHRLYLKKKDLAEIADCTVAMQKRNLDVQLHQRFFSLYRQNGFEVVQNEFGTPPRAEVFRFRHRKIIQATYRIIKRIKIILGENHV